MLSAFLRINLSKGSLTAHPIVLPNLKINSISHEDLMRYFNEDEANELYNNYYCKAILKLSTSITANFESNMNFVIFF